MQIIKYYDEITQKEIELEVTDRVANELNNLHQEQKQKNRQIRKNEFSVDEFHDPDNFLIDEGDDPLDAYIHKYENLSMQQRQEKRKKLLNKALKTLTKKERQVISGIYQKQLTQAEISRLLGISRSAVKQRYDSAMCRIKEFIINNE